MKRGLLSTIVLSVLVMAGLSSALQAQNMPEPDFYLSARVIEGHLVKLTWTKPTGIDIDHYIVHRTVPLANLPPVVIDSTDDTTSVDEPPLLYEHTFIYRVVGTAVGGGKLHSSDAIVTFSGSDSTEERIWITSIPPENAQVNIPYQYQVVATSSVDTAVLSYELHAGPDGMTMSQTGLIQWTPTAGQIGWNFVEVRVFSDLGGRRDQEFKIRVSGGNGIVEGTVKDTTGAPIGRVMIKLFSRNRDHHFEYRAITDSNGYYRINGIEPSIPEKPGTFYLARAVPLRPDFIGQWYNGVRHPDEATLIQVPDTSEGVTTVDFVLRARFIFLPKFWVSGTVTDSAGAPLIGAWVVFARTEFCFNASKHFGNGLLDDSYDRDAFDERNYEHQWRFDHRLDGQSAFVARTTTDSLGEYSIRLPLGSYIALSKAPGYSLVFYDQKSDFLAADIIRLTSDTTGIDFALKELPPIALGEISGTVLDTINNVPVMSRIIAFQERWGDAFVNTWYPRAHYTETDSTGAYLLTGLPPGKYYVLALPLGNYAPSFYSTGVTTMRWGHATPIEINGNAAAGIDIFVKPIPRWAFGYTWIRGSVFANALIENQGVARKSAAAVPLAGALVYATDASGALAGYGITNSDGSYSIDGLAPGNYSILVERPGYETGVASGMATYDMGGSPVPGTVNVTINTVTEAPETPAALPTGYVLEQNYPNPFNPSTQIVYSLPQNSQVSIVVFNLIGQRITTLVNGPMSAGTHQITWSGRDDAGNLVPTGVYLYRIEAGQFRATRKMLLLK